MKNLGKIFFYIFLIGVSFLLIFFVIQDVRPLQNASALEIDEKISNRDKISNNSIKQSNDQQSELKTLHLQNVSIPEYVLTTLMYVRSEGKAPKDFVGGRTFHNREKRLPKLKNDTYREWDVHPKKPNLNRGAERLVTSNTSSYYTKDHYNSFIPIKE
jgi:guanyl-specific ribonuclease Sa